LPVLNYLSCCIVARVMVNFNFACGLAAKPSICVQWTPAFLTVGSATSVPSTTAPSSATQRQEKHSGACQRLMVSAPPTHTHVYIKVYHLILHGVIPASEPPAGSPPSLFTVNDLGKTPSPPSSGQGASSSKRRRSGAAKEEAPKRSKQEPPTVVPVKTQDKKKGQSALKGSSCPTKPD
jgi:hypothetical protein